MGRLPQSCCGLSGRRRPLLCPAPTSGCHLLLLLQQVRTVVLRVTTVSALAQKAEYIWYDGQEGQESKGNVFNEMRSKTKVGACPPTTSTPSRCMVPPADSTVPVAPLSLVL